MPSHRKHHITPSTSLSTSTPASSTAVPHPNFSTQCHSTKLIYLCTHYTFTTKPFVINHVSPCPHHLTNRGRCNNMASVPYEKCAGELCSECRPVSLGLQPHLRSFEVLAGGKENKGKRVEGEGGDENGDGGGERDWAAEGEEIKKDLKALEEAFRGLDIKDTIDAGNAAKDKRRKDEGPQDFDANPERPKLWKDKGEWVNVKTRQETLATEPPPPSAVEKEENQTQAIKLKEQTPAAEKEEQQKPAELDGSTPTPALPQATGITATATETKHSFLTSLLKIFKPDTSHLSPTTPTTTTSSQTQTQNQSASTEPEVWVSIPADPDWETVTQEEKKEVDWKLWKDKGEWIKVNTTSKQET